MMVANNFSPIIESSNFTRALKTFLKERYNSEDNDIVLKKYGAKDFVYYNEDMQCMVWNDDTAFELTAEVLYPVSWGVYRVVE